MRAYQGYIRDVYASIYAWEYMHDHMTPPICPSPDPPIYTPIYTPQYMTLICFLYIPLIYPSYIYLYITPPMRALLPAPLPLSPCPYDALILTPQYDPLI